MWKPPLRICILLVTFVGTESLHRGLCPDACVRTYNPVCGDDGETYLNLCILKYVACRLQRQTVGIYYGFCRLPTNNESQGGPQQLIRARLQAAQQQQLINNQINQHVAGQQPPAVVGAAQGNPAIPVSQQLGGLSVLPVVPRALPPHDPLTEQPNPSAAQPLPVGSTEAQILILSQSAPMAIAAQPQQPATQQNAFQIPDPFLTMVQLQQFPQTNLRQWQIAILLQNPMFRNALLGNTLQTVQTVPVLQQIPIQQITTRQIG